MKNDDLKINVSSYEDLLKNSYENDGNDIYITYHLDENGNMVLQDDISPEVAKALGLDNLDTANISNGNVTLAVNGNDLLIDTLHYYTFDDSGKLISLSVDEVNNLINSNSSKSILFSENEVDSLVSSDLNLVNESLDNLVGYINPEGKLEYYAEAGEAGLFGAIYDVTNYYNNINNTLYSGIVTEAEAIKTIAHSYHDIDTAATNQVYSGIGSPSNTVYAPKKSGTPQYTINGMTADEINTSTKKMIADTKAAATNIKFDEISDFLSQKIEPGKAGKVSTSKLGDAINKIIPNLEADAQSCSDMIASIKDFTSQMKKNGKLKGDSWKKVKQNLKTYKSLLQASIDSSEFLANVLEIANQMIVDFLYPDTELDDSLLPKLEESLKEVNDTIDNLKEKIDQMVASQHEVCDVDYDKDGNAYNTNCRTEPSEDDINAVRNELTNQETIRDDLEKQIKRIYDFNEVLNNAQQLINDAIEQIKNVFENPVKDKNGNETFKANFTLDLSAYGALGNASDEFIKKFTKEGRMGTYDPDKLIDIGKTQKKVPYKSMNYGPKDSGDEGFGCAMFVAYCFNNLLYPSEDIDGSDKHNEGFYGGCSHFFGNITTDGFDAHNKGFIEVDPKDRQKGDIVCFVTTREDNKWRGSAKNCFHVAIYTGEGDKILHSAGFNKGGGVGYSTIDEYNQAKIDSLNRHHANHTLDDYDKKTYKGVKKNGIKIIYLRYVGPDAVQV